MWRAAARREAVAAAPAEAGTAGATGTGGAVANPVTPTKNGNRYRFAWGDVVLEVDAAAGARVAHAVARRAPT